MSIILSDVAPDFLRYYRRNPSWGLFHLILADGNWECVHSISEYVAGEAPRDRLAAKLADCLQKMEPWQWRRIAEVIPDMASGRKFDPFDLDDKPRCDFCGGEVDDDGQCLLDYCKGNHG
jgi:hypothetical protein